MLRFGCRMIALRSSQRVSNPISFVRIGRRFYDKYEPEEFDEESDGAGSGAEESTTKEAKKKIVQFREAKTILVDSNGKVLLNDTTYDKAKFRARREGMTLQCVMSGKGGDTVYKLVEAADSSKNNSKNKSDTKKKQTGKKIKEIRFSTATDTNDIDFKLDKAVNFLYKGHPVKLTMSSKLSFDFNPDECKQKLQEIVELLDNTLFKVQQQEIINRASSSIGVLLQPNVENIKKKKEQEKNEDDNTLDKE